MLNELRERLLGFGYEFATPPAADPPDGTPNETSNGTLNETSNAAPDEGGSPAETTDLPEKPALCLALRRALGFVRSFCNRLDWPPEDMAECPENRPDDWSDQWPEQWPFVVREAVLDLAAAYFLQAKMSLTPETLAVTPTLTSLRMGDAAWGFGGGTQKSGTDALSRTEALAGSLLRGAKAALCAWRAL